MDLPSERTGSNRSTWTRRAVLRGGVAAVGATALTAGSANAQLTEEAIIPVQDDYEQGLTGFFVHVGQTTDPMDANASDFCEFTSWPDDEILAFDARLIDRTAEPEEAEITLYLNDEVPVAPGTLFVVNDAQQCDDNYVGLQLERLGVEEVGDVAESTPTETTNGFGDGPGPLAALAGLLGAGWLLGRDRER